MEVLLEVKTWSTHVNDVWTEERVENVSKSFTKRVVFDALP